MELPKPITSVLSELTGKGFEAYVVGGCVRDWLMGENPKDFDITTNATPEAVKEVFSHLHVIETGIRHGTVTVISDTYPIEITTYRIDGEYKDRRRPANVEFTDSIVDDLARRDFTINAMAYSVQSGIIDPFNGRSDLTKKLIRCVGTSSKRFEEDALRILRAVRFASVLGFEIEFETNRALFQLRDTVLAVATERIASEFSKMICGNNIEIIMLEYAPLIAVILPEIIPSIGFNQNNPHHKYDVYTHTAKVMANTPPSLSLRLAALLHDIGKPETYNQDEDGIGHFHGHTKHGVEIARRILDRMKFDNETKKRVIDLVGFHDVQIPPEPRAVKHVLNRFSEDFFVDLIDLKKADVLGQIPELIIRIPELDKLLEIYETIVKENSCFSLKDLAINGENLILLGVPHGSQIGVILNDCLTQVMCDNIQNNREDLMEYVEMQYLPGILKD